MNAAETIQAAIDKLEALVKAAADEDGVSWDIHSPATGELTVTLHRTIDAQLAILRDTHRLVTTSSAFLRARPEVIGRSLRRELLLARAILGVES